MTDNELYTQGKTAEYERWIKLASKVDKQTLIQRIASYKCSMILSRDFGELPELYINKDPQTRGRFDGCQQAIEFLNA
jgi:hypothetical protein